MKTLDTLEIYDQSTGKIPFLLLDGQNSCFGLPFLEYINKSKNTWRVCIGVPYGTSYWQIGDSLEQNRCFKMYSSKKKKAIVSYKTVNKAGRADVLPEDIISIVNYAWLHSFADKNGNRKATM